MLTVQTSALARAAIIARLADNATGFNPRFTARLAALGLTLPSSFRTPINFTPGTSKNFFTCDLEPADFTKSTAYTMPLMTLYPMASEAQRLQRPRQFAGPVTHGCKVFLEWPSTSAANVLVPLAEAAQDSLISTFNDLTAPIPEWSQQWANANAPGTDLMWGGDIAVQLSRLQAEGESWSIALHARLTLDVFVG